MNCETRVSVACCKKMLSSTCDNNNDNKHAQEQQGEEHLQMELEQAWKGALALNNAAVGLFARGCFEQGKGLLRQAMDLIRFCSLPEPRMCQKNAVSAQLKCAEQHIAQLSFLTRSMPMCDCIQVLENSAGFPMAPTDCNSILFSFVRMEAVFGSGTTRDAAQVKMDLEIHSATILYNMGVLKICQEIAFTCQGSQAVYYLSDKTKHAAIQMFQATHALLARSGAMRSGIPDSCACVNLLSLRFLALLLSSMPGREVDASNAAKVLQETQHHFDFVTSLLSCGTTTMGISMAAAA